MTAWNRFFRVLLSSFRSILSCGHQGTLADDPSPQFVVTAEHHDPLNVTHNSEALESSTPPNSNQHIVITHIRANNVASDRKLNPAGFYVSLQFGGVKRRTTNKPLLVDKDVIEWDDEILLPSELTTVIRITLFTSFELTPMLGNGGTLCTVELSVEELLNHSENGHPIMFLPALTSILVTLERRGCNDFAAVSNRYDSHPNSDESHSLAQTTDLGHNALLRYHEYQRKPDLERALEHFESALENCPRDHRCRATVLFNLAAAKFVAGHVEGNIDAAISLYREALALRGVGHPDRPVTLSHLIHALLLRSRAQQGDQIDPDEVAKFLIFWDPQNIHSSEYQSADRVLRACAQYRTAGSRTTEADLKEALITICMALQERFQRIGDIVDLSQSILVMEETIQFTPDGHPERQETLSSLGSSFLSRFDHVGNKADLEKAISVTEEALKTAPDTQPDRPQTLNNLSVAYLRRFGQLRNLADLDRSISITEKAVEATPHDHSAKPVMLGNLGISRLDRFELLHDVADLDKSVAAKEEAIKLTPDSHLDKPERLHGLCRSLLERYERLGNTLDLENSITALEEAARLTPGGHPNRVMRLINLSGLFLSRFERNGSFTDLERSISILEEASPLTPDGHAERPKTLMNLGNSLLTRFLRLGNLADLEKSISIMEEAVKIAPDGHPDRLGMLSNLGVSYVTRFERFGNPADLDRSIVVKEEALRTTPDNHPDRPTRLNNLCSSFFRRFERLGDLKDLDRAASLMQEAVQLTPEGHPDLPSRLTNLGVVFLRRFERVDHIADLDKSISMIEEAVQIIPQDHAIRPTLLNGLGGSFLTRFLRLGNLADLNKSIAAKEEALQNTANGHPDRAERLSNLGNSLLRRYERLEIPADLDRSISLTEEALKLTPDRHPDKPKRLINLGSTFLLRFKRVGHLSDLEGSISTNTEALKIIPGDHPDRPKMLVGLGTSYFRRFGQSGNIPDIEEAISKMEEAVEAIPDGHPDKPQWLNDLGRSFLARYERCSDHPALHSAISYFSRAARSSVGPTTAHFEASKNWIQCARLLGQNSWLLDAYRCAVNLLARLAWIGLPLEDRYHGLLEAVDVAREAASTALELGQPQLAVEWLEQGRSVVWAGQLQLRTPVDELRADHPDFADKLDQLSGDLERAGATHEKSIFLLSDSQSQPEASPEKQALRYRALVIERDQLLEKIRSLPKFRRFLLPKPFSELRAHAHSGPIVLLNASKRRCDALIIMAGLDTPVHVPLPDITYEDVESLRTTLTEELSGRAASRDEEDSARGARLDKPDFGSIILSKLWSKVVQPILNAIGLSIPGKLPRIFWCPTGPFAFLPIHAAGHYTMSEPGNKVSDFVISSYTPTLSALTLPEGEFTSSSVRLLAVAQPSTDGQTPLSGTRIEIEDLKTLIEGRQSSVPCTVNLVESNGMVGDVLTKMKNSDWVHFACHGVQDLTNPAESGLCLAEQRRLRLLDIIRLSRPRGGLAFLSACQTATGDTKLPEEAVHLAAGMLFAGYGGVIGTMWNIRDNIAPEVAKDVYKQLFKGDAAPDYRNAARALHNAVGRLRTSSGRDVPFTAWVPFIHIGL